MCKNDDRNIDPRRWSKRCLLTRGDQTLKNTLSKNIPTTKKKEIPEFCRKKQQNFQNPLHKTKLKPQNHGSLVQPN